MNNLRSYYFRHMVAEHDNQWRRIRKGPMTLTWRDARYYWKAATKLANNHYNQISR